VTEECDSTRQFRTNERIVFQSRQSNNVGITDLRVLNTESNPSFTYDQGVGYITYSGGGGSQTQYWRLSEVYKGDRVTAYGGVVTFKFKFSGGGAPVTDPLLVLKGNLITLFYMGESRYDADREHIVRFKLFEVHTFYH
jgi:hypothetical protein